MAKAGSLIYDVDLETKDAEKDALRLGDIIKANIISEAIISGVKELSKALINIGKASVQAYADYEQLVGGVDTLFKKSSKKVQQYAQVAYKTAGLSANQYMETVTSFSASLLQGLGNDTEKASEYANMAIIDMSDNANKMGTSMEAIQNAYQGFAKQNYTMLDNLKLGYGGTKTEMERLIADANKVKEANGEMANLSIDSFADVTEAIHIIQTEMDITGTTSKEASSTISGSINSMKGAWENLKVAIASGEGIDERLQEFQESVKVVAENVIPVIQTVLDTIKQQIANFMNDLWNTVVNNPTLRAIGAALSTILPLIAGIWGYLKAVAIIKTVTNAFKVLNTVLMANPWALVIGAIVSLVSTFIYLWNTCEEFRNFWFGAWEGMKKFVQDAITVLTMVWNEFVNMFNNTLNNISTFVTSITEGISGAFEDAVIWITDLFTNFGTFIEDFFTEAGENITYTVTRAWDGIVDGAGKAVAGIKNAFKTIPDWFKNTFSSAWQKVKDVFSTGGAIFTGITEGITATFKRVVGKILEGLNTVIRKPFDGINGIIDKINGAKWPNGDSIFNLGHIPVPQVPTQLATGIAMAKKGHQYLLEGQGDEAVIPLAKNSEWISKLASNILNKMSMSGRQSELSSAINSNSNLNATLFAEIVMDKQTVGQVVAPVVVKTIRQGGAC